MDYETFQKNKDIEARIVARDKKYVKTTTIMRNGIKFHTSEYLTEEEMLEEVQAAKEQPPYSTRGVPGTYYNGGQETDYKAIQMIIMNINDDVMRYKLDTYWYIMPSNRSYDIMGIGIEANKVQINSGIDFREDWWTTSNTTDHTTGMYEKIESTGGVILFPLPSGSLDSLEQYMYFNVIKKSGVGTIYSLTATGDYAHATATVSNNVYNYMSVNVAGGIVIDNPYANSFDEMSAAMANFIGTW